MKLSATSREYVAKQVKNAFAEELKKANDAVEAERSRREELFKSVRAEVDKVLDGAKREVEKVVKRMKLTFHGDKCIDHLEVFASPSHYDSIDADTFEETRECCEKMQELHHRVSKIEADIRAAVSKALFEIEISGRKSDLEQIIANVIAEIKEGK